MLKMFLTTPNVGLLKKKQLDESITANLSFYNQNLNPSQHDAIRFALRTNDIACILGPPGTGKTTTLGTHAQLQHLFIF